MPTIKHISDQSGKSNKAGFSLLELAIFMGIVGLVGATSLQTYKTYTNNKAIQITKGRFAEIDSALTQYLTKKTYLPCPADPSLPPSNIDSGKEISTCATDATEGNVGSCAGGYCRSPGRDANSNGTKDLVLSGYVPYNTLGLAMKDSLDGWGRKIKYVVTAKLTKPAPVYNASHGAISVIAPNGANVLLDGAAPGTGQVVILSHGADGKGGYTLNGNLFAACPAATDGRDFENCNEPVDAKYHDNRDRSFISGPGHYDDWVQRKYTIVSNADRWSSSTTTMRNAGVRRVGIGTATPTNHLHVAGNIKAGELVAKKLCEYGGNGSVTSPEGKAGKECLPYSLFGSTGSYCPTGSMKGIKDAQAVCALAIPPNEIAAGGCNALYGPGTVMCGVRANKTIRCRVPTDPVCPP